MVKKSPVAVSRHSAFAFILEIESEQKWKIHSYDTGTSSDLCDPLLCGIKSHWFVCLLQTFANTD